MILAWLILIPFIGGLTCWLIERAGNQKTPRWVALGSMLFHLGFTLHLWWTSGFAADANGVNPQWLIDARVPWIPELGISIHLGIDGLSMLMVVLTSFLGVMAVLCSWREIDRHVGFFYLNLLWNLGGVVGVFLALDLFLYFFFWEMMLVPMYFLIALWGHNAPGGKGKVYAATKFFMFTQASGFLMLLSILGLVWINHSQTGTLSFEYEDLKRAAQSLDLNTARWLMLGFFVAFAVKLPVVPFHSWLPDAHSQAPTAGSVDLAGILLKTAAYGLLRFAIPFFPAASAWWAPYAISLGVLGIVYGAMLAFVQTDIKRLIAYTSISHMGFVLLGIYSGSQQSLQGVIMQMVAHGISAAGLFILCGEIYERLHTRDMREMGGLWSRLPYLPPIMLFFAAASMGLPGLGNFVGEFLILIGSFAAYPWLSAIATTGLVLAAVYSLVMLQRAFYGPARDPSKLKDLSKRELTVVLTLMVTMVWLGIFPQTVLNTALLPVRDVQSLYAAARGQTPGAGVSVGAETAPSDETKADMGTGTGTGAGVAP